MKKILVSAAVMMIVGVVNAQFVYDYLKAADTYFQKGDYASAAEYYEKYLGEKKDKSKEYNPYTPQNSSKKSVGAVSSREQAIYRLAESYRFLHYPAKAEPRY